MNRARSAQRKPAIEADLDIVARTALMGGPHMPVGIDQDEFGLGAAAIDA